MIRRKKKEKITYVYCKKCGTNEYRINQKTGICSVCKYPDSFISSKRESTYVWEEILLIKNIHSRII